MIDDGGGLINWTIHAILISYTALLTWLGKGMYNDVKDLKDHQSDCELSLANFRTEVSKDYAKDITIQASLARVHDKMETRADKASFKELSDEMKEIRTDIKSILKMVGKNGRA